MPNSFQSFSLLNPIVIILSALPWFSIIWGPICNVVGDSQLNLKLRYSWFLSFFYSNTGGTSIAKKTLEHWRQARNREDLELNDFEPNVTLGAFNEAGMIFTRSIVKKVDLYHNLKW